MALWKIALFLIVPIIFFSIMILFTRERFKLGFRRFLHKEKALDIIIILKNGNLLKGVVKVQGDKFTFGKDDYIIKKEAIYTQKFRLNQRPYAFYLEGIADPLIFDFKTKKAVFSGEDLKKFAESKFIQQLLSTNEEKMIPIIMILVIVQIVILLIIGYFIFKFTGDTELLLDNIRQVITR